ncbi:universal stress protein [Acidicapsa ligni]|uniref:universal stress protein n=1 Tax=Acidicapsa ligni TaxID=542300 RepID=UPI0021E02C81|nr:universal stress protein [Acidicapsa ligni]
MDYVRKILFPVDFSTRSSNTAKQVKVWASRLSAEVIVMHAVDPANFSNDPERNAIDFEEHTPFYIAEAKRLIEFFCEEHLSGVKLTTSVAAGSTLGIISDTAVSESVELIMIPRGHHGYASRFLRDPIVSGVLDKCPMPVWTTEHDENLTDAAPRAILCPLDIDPDVFLDAENEGIIAFLKIIAASFDATVTCLYVSGSSAERDSAVEARAATMRDSLGTFAKFERAGGNVQDAIRRAMAEEKPDLVIMGRTRSGEAGLTPQRHILQIDHVSSCPVISVGPQMK